MRKIAYLLLLVILGTGLIMAACKQPNEQESTFSFTDISLAPDESAKIPVFLNAEEQIEIKIILDKPTREIEFFLKNPFNFITCGFSPEKGDPLYIPPEKRGVYENTILVDHTGIYKLCFRNLSSSKASIKAGYRVQITASGDGIWTFLKKLFDPIIRDSQSIKWQIDQILGGLGTQEDTTDFGTRSGILTSIILACSFLWLSLANTKTRRESKTIVITLTTLLTLLPFFCFIYGFFISGNTFIKVNTRDFAYFYLTFTAMLAFILLVFWSPMIGEEETIDNTQAAIQKHQTSVPLISAMLAIFLSIIIVLGLSIATFADMAKNSSYGLVPILICYCLPFIFALYSYLTLPHHFVNKANAILSENKFRDTISCLSANVRIGQMPTTYSSDRMGPIVFGNIIHYGIIIPEHLKSFTLALSGNNETKANILVKFLLLHELSHIKNKDVLFMSWASYFLSLSKWWLAPMIVIPIPYLILFHSNVFGAFFVVTALGLALLLFYLLYLSISRQREILADMLAISYMSTQEKDSLLKVEPKSGKQTYHNLLMNLPLLSITSRVKLRKSSSLLNRLQPVHSFLRSIGKQITHVAQSLQRLSYVLSTHPSIEERVREVLREFRDKVAEPPVLSKQNALWVGIMTFFLLSLAIVLILGIPALIFPSLDWENSNVIFMMTHSVIVLLSMIGAYLIYAHCGSFRYSAEVHSWRRYFAYLQNFSKVYGLSFGVCLLCFLGTLGLLFILGVKAWKLTPVPTLKMSIIGVSAFYFIPFIIILFLAFLKLSPAIPKAKNIYNRLQKFV